MDVDEIVGYFTPDGIYHNMPIAPVAGTAMLKGFIAAFLKDWTETRWDVINVLASANTVIAERVDHIHIGDKACALPVVGVFELQGGKIAAWRDYFDMGTYAAAFA
jgi:limonene-1,2-epoxide hydrolase